MLLVAVVKVIEDGSLYIPLIYEHARNNVENGDSFEISKEVVERIPELVGERLISYCVKNLNQFLRTALKAFSTDDYSFPAVAYEFISQYNEAEATLKPMNANMLRNLEFLTTCTYQSGLKYLDQEAMQQLARAAYFSQFIADPKLARAANLLSIQPQIITALLADFGVKYLYGFRFYLQIHPTYALYWLSGILESHSASACADLLDLFRDEDFWRSLQELLVNGSSEQKKLCLYIVEVSVSLVSTNIELPGVFKFQVEREKQYISIWNKYLTIAHIIAIDTSAHQTKATLPELTALIKLSTTRNAVAVPHIWLMALLKIGLKASLPSVRVEIANYILAFSSDQLRLFETIGHEVLIYDFLPFVGQASFFNVSDVNQRCAHGESLSKFISCLMENIDKAQQFLEDLLTEFAYGKRKWFEACVFYMIHGISKSFANSQVANAYVISRLLYKISQQSYENQRIKTCISNYICKIWFSFRSDQISLHEFFDLTFMFENRDELALQVAEWISKCGLKSEFLEEIRGRIDSLSIMDPEPLEFKQFRFIMKVAKCADIELPQLDFCKLPLLIQICMVNYLPTDLHNLVALSIFQQAEIDLKNCAYRQAFKYLGLCQLSKSSSAYDPLLATIENIIGSDFDIIISVADPVDFFRTVRALFILKGVADEMILDRIFRYLVNYMAASRNIHEIRQVSKEFTKLIQISADLCSISGKFTDLLELAEISIQRMHSAEQLSIYCKVCLILIESDPEQAGRVLSLGVKIWRYIIEYNLSVSKHSASLDVIRILFNHNVLKYAYRMRHEIDLLSHIAQELVPLGYARRSILPVLTREIEIFRCTCTADFEGSEWLAKILVDIYCLEQNHDNVFLVEDSVVQISLVEGIENVPQIEPEGVARIRCANILGATVSRGFGSAAISAVFEATPSLFSNQSTDAASEVYRIALAELFVLLNRFAPEKCLQQAHETLRNEFSPLVRTYLEWYLALNLTSPELQQKFIWNNLDIPEDKPRFLASLLVVASVIATSYSDQTKLILEKLIPMLIAFATTNRAVLRHTATSLLMGLESYVLDLQDPVAVRTMKILKSHVLSSPTFGAFKYGQDILWDAQHDFNVFGICGQIARWVNEDTASASKRSMKVDLFDDIKNFDSIPIFGTSGKTKRPTIKNQTNLEIKPSLSAIKSVEATTLQTKSNTRIRTAQPARATKGHMIVLASLVEKAPNLGGICRLSDVLGAELLCVPDMTVLKSKEFQSVAVTADKWMPMAEVCESQIVEYISECRKKGYKIWGLEQTDNSVLLTDKLQFPEKVVMILGKEKEGIPPHILRELDCAIEIKQVGVVRSMNIQTATAVIVHAYSVQYC
ncbi:uncharacterized protein V1516DRAFT_620084 [Lipomyces oligophaga]|uniref:uncharacterized protein n=1 Tax=Lipomyces oligophaga TaxID=45792 RepID=UPI0034CF7619